MPRKKKALQKMILQSILQSNMSAYSKDGRLLKCDRNIHPSEILIGELQAREIDIRAFLNEYPILKTVVGKQGTFTQEIADVLERTLGITADFWLAMQKDFDSYETTNP